MMAERWMPRRKAGTPQHLSRPRNAAAIIAAIQAGTLKPGEHMVASFVGDTPIDAPTVYADSGRSYDWSFAKGLCVCIVVKPGVDTGKAISDLYKLASVGSTPSLVDFESKLLGWVMGDVVASMRWQQPGGYEWNQLFG